MGGRDSLKDILGLQLPEMSFTEYQVLQDGTVLVDFSDWMEKVSIEINNKGEVYRTESCNFPSSKSLEFCYPEDSDCGSAYCKIFQSSDHVKQDFSVSPEKLEQARRIICKSK